MSTHLIIDLRPTSTRTVTALFLFAFVACASKPTSGDASSVGYRSAEVMQAAYLTTGAPHDIPLQASQKETPAPNSESILAEAILRDGTVVHVHPSMSEPLHLTDPPVDRSKISLICFPDCKDVPRDSSMKDVIVLTNGERKTGEITRIAGPSYNPFRKIWEGNSVTLTYEQNKEIPFTEIRYIKFADHVFYSLEQALGTPGAAKRLIMRHYEQGKKHMSPGLGKLVNLRELEIACLEDLIDLPSEIGNLRKLEKLIMNNGNGCSMNVALPPSIGQLEHLRVLDLYGATSKRLPATISNLQNLEELDLGHNGIPALPPQVASFHKLKRLSLDYDNIQRVPAFVGSLTLLKELSLMHNSSGPARPVVLPQSLSALKGLKVSLGNNYLTLKSQERLRKRFPNIVFEFGDEFDDSSSNETAPEPKQKP